METFLLENEHIINSVYYNLMEKSGPKQSMVCIYSLLYASVLGAGVYFTLHHINSNKLRDFISNYPISIFKSKPIAIKQEIPAIERTSPETHTTTTSQNNEEDDGYISDFEY
jgi:hypothetical protein